MLKPYGYFDGTIKKVGQARIAPHDIGLLRGYGVFDFFRTYNSMPFLMKEHITRFKKSAQRLGLKINIDEKQIADLVQALLKKNKIKDGSFRMVLTGGPTENGIDSTGATFYILVYDPNDPLPSEYTEGSSLITHEHLRHYPESKTNNYITAVSLQPERKKKGAIEILYTHNGHILECATCNIFIVKNGIIYTPLHNILLGMTRNKVITLASKKYKVEERDISLAEALKADECFITNTTKNVMPIVRIDNKKIGNGKVGPITQDIIALFKAYIEKTCKIHK